jgi:hypothetical protein
VLLQAGRRQGGEEDQLIEVRAPAGRFSLSTPIKSPLTRPLRVTSLGAAASVPWCCILPALLASAGVASSLAGRILGGARSRLPGPQHRALLARPLPALGEGPRITDGPRRYRTPDDRRSSAVGLSSLAEVLNPSPGPTRRAYGADDDGPLIGPENCKSIIPSLAASCGESGPRPTQGRVARNSGKDLIRISGTDTCRPSPRFWWLRRIDVGSPMGSPPE